MRSSDVDICNQALALLGVSDSLQSLSDETPQARRCKQLFETSAAQVLRMHDWNCAKAFTELAQSTTAPEVQYDYAYPLPHDCVRVIEAYSDETCYNPYDRWDVVGRSIHTDSDELWLKYVRMPEDYQDLDVLLATAIAYQLALNMAATVVKDKEMYQVMEYGFRNALKNAQAIDTMETKELFEENNRYEDARMI